MVWTGFETQHTIAFSSVNLYGIVLNANVNLANKIMNAS